MNESQSGKGNIGILVIVLIMICLGAGIYGYLSINSLEGEKNNRNNKKENDEIPQVIENNFERVAVSGLNDKLNGLSFINKTTAAKYEDEWVRVDSKISSGRVTISIKFEDEENVLRSYTVDDIENAISIGTGISIEGSGSVRTYILTSDGKVYYVDDDFNSVLADENYKGEIVDMKISGATAIAVVDENFSLSDISEATMPTVYIKTNDGKLYTDEYLLEVQDGLVEVYEQ